MRIFVVLAILVCICGCLAKKSNQEMAIECLRKKDSVNALIYLDKAFSEDKNERACYVAAKLYIIGYGIPKNYEKAERYLQQYGKSCPSAEPLFWRACLYSTGGYGLGKDPLRAKSLLEQAANMEETEEELPDPLFSELSGLLLKSEKYPEFLKWALSMNRLLTADFLLGCLYYDGEYVKQDYPRAVKYFCDADADDYDSSVMTAEAYIKGHGVGKDLSKAEKIYKRLIKDGHEFPEYRLGVMFYMNGRTEDGEKILLKLSESGYPYAKNFLAYKWAKQSRNLDRAESMIKDVLKEKPDKSAYIDTYGYVLLKKGRNKEALELFLKAEKDGSPAVKSHVGDAYFALGEKEKARNYWSESLKLIKDDDELKKEIQNKLDGIKH